MIFVTVGTHEQAFDRLLQYMDELKGNGVIEDDVILQTGFSTYEPKYCKWSTLFPFQQMVENIHNARIVITHGAPSTFILSLKEGKIPIVVPRQKQFNEHVNDHQIVFCKAVFKRQGNIILVEDISQLQRVILNYDSIMCTLTNELKSNNQKFNEDLERMVKEMFEGRNSSI